MSAILAAILDISKNLFSAKMQHFFLTLVENMCSQPQINRNIIKNRVEKKEIKTNFNKKLIDCFCFQTLICIINFAYIISDDVIQLTSKDVFIIGL